LHPTVHFDNVGARFPSEPSQGKMTRNARRVLFDVGIPSESVNRAAWRSVSAGGCAVLVSCFLAAMNWWRFSGPARPGAPSPMRVTPSAAGYAWDLRPSQPMGSPVKELISAAPASAVILFIAFGVFLSITGCFSLRKFALGARTGLSVMVLSGAAWALITRTYALPNWLDIGFLIPNLLALAASIWTARPQTDPTIREAQIPQFVASQMSAVSHEKDPSPWGWLLPAVAVVVGASFAWSARPIPRAQSLVWSSLWIAAVRYVLLVQIGAIFAAGLAYAALKYRGVSLQLRYGRVLGAAAIAWLGPLVLFVTQASWWAAVAIIIVVSSAARLAYSGYHGHAEEIPQESSPSFELLAAAPLPPFFRQILPGLAAAFCLNSLVFAAIANRPLIATLLCGVSAAIISWQWTAWTYSAERRAASLLGWIVPLAVCVATAIMFTAGGLTRYLREGGTIDVHTRSGNIPTRLVGDVPSYKGVILFEERRPEKLLLPRPTALLSHQTLSPTASQPLNIPFDGVYWFYQPPDHHPREDSLRKRGSPAELRFQSSDGRPLLMEARQNLGRLVDVDCCNEIMLTITNAEADSTLVALELSLANTTLPGMPVLALGSAKATGQGTYNAQKNAQQTLVYKIPAAPTISQFDELIVAFHRAEPITIRSTKVAIHEFVLVPRH